MNSVPPWVVLLTGASAGAVVTMISNVLLKRSEWRREDRHRFLEDRREAYAAMLGQLNAYWQALIIARGRLEILEAAATTTGGSEIATDEIFREVTKSLLPHVEEFQRATAAVYLLGSDPVRNTMNKLNDAVRALFDVIFAEDSERRSTAAFPDQQRNDFIDAARTELGIDKAFPVVIGGFETGGRGETRE